MASPEQCEILQKIIYEHPKIITAIADGYDLWICPEEGTIYEWPLHNDICSSSNRSDLKRLHWDVRLADLEMQPGVFAKIFQHLEYLDRNETEIITNDDMTPDKAKKWSSQYDEKNKKLFEFLRTRYG
jgi:hypothetical protein